jgi:hypothetical protein
VFFSGSREFDYICSGENGKNRAESVLELATRSPIRLKIGKWFICEGHRPLANQTHAKDPSPCPPFLGASILDLQLALDGEARAPGSRRREEGGRKGEERKGKERNKEEDEAETTD